jgi:hypothetical protein
MKRQEHPSCIVDNASLPFGPVMNAPKTMLCLLVLTAACVADTPAKSTVTRKPNFTVGKDTTYVTGPVDKDGYVDYSAALNERLGKGVTPETNANVLIWQAIGPRPLGGKPMPTEFFQRMGMDEPPEKGEYFVHLPRYLRDRKIEDPEVIAETEKELSATGEYPWAAKDHPQIAEWLKANEKPLDLIVEATKRKHYFSPVAPKRTLKGSSGVISVLIPGVQTCRAITSALISRAMLRINEGKADDAWRDLLACHRLARHVGRGAMLIDNLVGIATEGLAQRADIALLDIPVLDSKHLIGYLRELQSLPPMPAVADVLDVGERYSFLDTVMLVDRNGAGFIREVFGLPGDDDEKLPPGPLEKIDWNPGLRSANKWFDRLAAASRGKDRPTREDLFAMFETDIKDLKSELINSEDLRKALRGVGISPAARGKLLGEYLVSSLLPAAWRIQQSADRCEQGRRNLHIAFALAAYRCDHKSYPKSLDDLAPRYLDKVPDDLFTGKPLLYRGFEKSCLVYSVGPNGVDDDGQSPRDEPRGDDIAVRIPIPIPKNCGHGGDAANDGAAVFTPLPRKAREEGLTPHQCSPPRFTAPRSVPGSSGPESLCRAPGATPSTQLPPSAGRRRRREGTACHGAVSEPARCRATHPAACGQPRFPSARSTGRASPG